jgi:hypothetical protein
LGLCLAPFARRHFPCLCDLALTVILLDRAGLKSEALAPGAMVALSLDNDLHRAFCDLLHCAFPDRVVDDDGDNRFGSDLWIVDRSAAPEYAVVGAARKGAACVVGSDAGDGDKLLSLVRRAAGTVYTTAQCGQDVVEQLLAVLFDADVEAPLALCSIKQVLIACRDPGPRRRSAAGSSATPRRSPVRDPAATRSSFGV